MKTKITLELLHKLDAWSNSCIKFSNTFPGGIDIPSGVKVVKMDDEDLFLDITWLISRIHSSIEKVIGPDGDITTFERDSLGYVIKEISQIGRTYTYERDSKGNILKKTGPDGRTYTYERDSKGNILKKTDQDGRTWTYERDSLGYVVKEINQCGDIWIYERDSMGRAIKMTYPEGTIYTYDMDQKYDGTITFEWKDKMKSNLTKSQFKKIIKHYVVEEDGLKYLTQEQRGRMFLSLRELNKIVYKAVATLRFDDRCGNGHNTFSITTDNGCDWDEIKTHFPELEKYIKWHLCSTDGPLHYIANSLYHASDKDHNGKRKGDALHFEKRIRFNRLPYLTITLDKKAEAVEFIEQHDFDLTNFEIIEVRHKEENTFKPKYTLKGMDEIWHKCPWDTRTDAWEWILALCQNEYHILDTPTSFSKGKEPNLEFARSSAIWEDAELEDFTEEKLKKRLPALLKEFKSDMEELCFVW